MRAINRKLFRDLVRIRTQAIAIAAVVASGVAVSVLGLCNLQTLTKSRAEFYEQGRFGDVFASVKRAPRSIAARLENIPGVAAVEVRSAGTVLLDMPDLPEPVAARIIGLPDGRRPLVNDIVLRRGRDIDDARPDEVLVSESFASAHRLEPDGTVRCIINNRRRTLTVAGIALSPEFVYAIRPGSLFPDDKRFGVLWMAEKPLAGALGLEGAFNDAALRLNPGVSAAAVIERVNDTLARFGGPGAFDRSEQISHWFLEGELSELRTTSRILPMMFAAVAAFVLNIVVARLIATQREQIGLMKAFGYRSRTVAAHYAGLALVIAIAGVLAGVPLGIGLGWSLSGLYAQFFHFPALVFAVPIDAIAVSALTAIMVTMGGTGFAVRGVLALRPAEAMRPAAPARFRPTLFERFGLTALTTPATRIMLRNLERRPVRALLSVAAIALAVGIMVLGRLTDALEYIIETELEVAQQQTATVTFVEPRPTSAAYDLAGYPGVIGVEPFRVVPVTFRNGRHTHRGSITGIPASPVLSRVLDAARRPVTIPGEGLVISEKLSRMLEVQPGASVTVEIREGTRPVRIVVVEATVRDYLGTPAYMSIAALGRLLREGPSMSGAHLLVDETREIRLFERLKETPGVADFSVIRSVRDSIRATLSRSMGMSLSFLIVLAGVIAFGVVYNTARVALSERAWELATLRVIGFTRREVGFILLSESALLLLVALPAGLVLGRGEAALLSAAYDSAQYRIPAVFTHFSYGFATVVVIGAAFASALVVWRLISRLDLVAVLKTRE